MSRKFSRLTREAMRLLAPAKIRRFQETGGRIVYLTAPQCAALEISAAQDQNENVHCFVVVGLRTGMRHQEILRIRKEHIDLEREVIWIPRAKAGATEQPITKDLARYLEERLAMLAPGCPWLFPSTGSRTGHAILLERPSGAPCREQA
jgi:integrase